MSRPLASATLRVLCAEPCAPAGAFSIEKEEDRLLLIKAIIHAADISNPVRPFHVNCVLSSGVHREFRWISPSAVERSVVHKLQQAQANW